MKPSDHVRCEGKDCGDVDVSAYSVPGVELDPDRVSVLLVSEAAPRVPSDNYYAEGDPLFQRTTVQAFRDAGVEADSIMDLVSRGVYFTTAVKCGKIGYGVGSGSVKACSWLLEREFELFARLRAVLLMGDIAIKAFNEVAKRGRGRPVVPSGSTYKIRSGEFTYKGIRVFPSYLQAGPAFFIEKSKRRMIAEDIRRALAVAGL